jgi:hypothetical protein
MLPESLYEFYKISWIINRIDRTTQSSSINNAFMWLVCRSWSSTCSRYKLLSQFTYTTCTADFIQISARIHEHETVRATRETMTEWRWFCTFYFQLTTAERFYPETLRADELIKTIHFSSTTNGVNMAAPLTTRTKVEQQCFDYCGLKTYEARKSVDDYNRVFIKLIMTSLCSLFHLFPSLLQLDIFQNCSMTTR